MRYSKGFNLIELMVVVFIVSVLTAIALPAYTNYMIRGKIPDATSNLASKRVQMEQFFQDNRTYANSNLAAVGTTPAGPCATDSTSSKYFVFTCTAQGVAGTPPSVSNYVITASGYNPLNAVNPPDHSMAGFTYTIGNWNAVTGVSQDNVKTSTITAPAPTGWPATSTSCWITKTGGAC